MNNSHITSVEWGYLVGERPRVQGSNARLGEHGQTVRDPIVRITLEDGTKGFGRSRGTPDEAATLTGLALDDVFDPAYGVKAPYRKYEYAIWDAVGHQTGLPIYQISAQINNGSFATPFTVPCYDTSLYFDDLHLESHDAAADLIVEEAMQGYERGHRAFKIKVGRGGRHMPLEDGTLRDIKIIKAVRAAVGSEPPIMIDANNGWNLNLTKRVLEETADCDILWMEEAFHEDPVLYEDLKAWMQQHGLKILIADGEGHADFDLIKWAKEGLIDVIQYDVYGHGFTDLLEVGRDLNANNIRFAPHHYGSAYGNYISCHLWSAVSRMIYVEWDTVHMPGLITSGYTLDEGIMSVPNAPGFGLSLDETTFKRAITESGGTASA